MKQKVKNLTIKDCTCANKGSGGNTSCRYCHPQPLKGGILGQVMSLATRGLPAATRPKDQPEKKDE